MCCEQGEGGEVELLGGGRAGPRLPPHPRGVRGRGQQILPQLPQLRAPPPGIYIHIPDLTLPYTQKPL